MKSFWKQLLSYFGIFIAILFVVSVGLPQGFINTLTVVSIIFIGIITLSMAFASYAATFKENTTKRKQLRQLASISLKAAVFYVIGIALFVLFSAFLNNFLSTNHLTVADVSWIKLLDLTLFTRNPFLYLSISGISVFGSIILLLLSFSGELLLDALTQFLILECEVKKKLKLFYKLHTKIKTVVVLNFDMAPQKIVSAIKKVLESDKDRFNNHALLIGIFLAWTALFIGLAKSDLTGTLLIGYALTLIIVFLNILCVVIDFLFDSTNWKKFSTSVIITSYIIFIFMILIPALVEFPNLQAPLLLYGIISIFVLLFIVLYCVTKLANKLEKVETKVNAKKSN